MTETCHITIELEKSRLAISVLDSEAQCTTHLTRGIDSIDQINHLSRLYRSLVALRSFVEEDDQGVISAIKELGKQLYKLFFEGLEETLCSCSSIFLEHSLFFLPLELAYDGEDFLGLKYSMGNWLRGWGTLPKTQEQELASPLLSPTLRILLLGFENESVSNTFSSGHNSFFSCEVLKRARSEDILQKLHHDNYSLIHFACHGRYNPTDPEQSYLILDQEKAGILESALLTSKQIQHTRLPKSLVFLNACQSGSVEEDYRGFVGFADAILQTGATSCITTLWSLSDRSASRFAVHFYTHLLQGNSIGNALQEARLQCWLDKRDILTGLSYILFGHPSVYIQRPNAQEERKV